MYQLLLFWGPGVARSIDLSKGSEPFYYPSQKVMKNVVTLSTIYTYFTFIAPCRVSLVPRTSHLTPNSVVRHAHGNDSKFMIVH